MENLIKFKGFKINYNIILSPSLLFWLRVRQLDYLYIIIIKYLIAITNLFDLMLNKEIRIVEVPAKKKKNRTVEFLWLINILNYGEDEKHEFFTNYYRSFLKAFSSIYGVFWTIEWLLY